MKAEPELGTILAKAVCDIMKGGSLGLNSPSDAHRLLILAEHHFAIHVAKRLNGTGYLVGATQ